MTPEDRAAFTHGQGIAPTPDNAEVKKLMQKHFDENLPEHFHAENADSSVSIPDIPKGASLSDLPGYATPGAPPTPPGDSTHP